MKRNISIFATLLFFSPSIWADPYTDILFGSNPGHSKISNYFERKPIIEKGSLPVVSSFFDGARGRIQGSSFVISSDDKKYLITNAHLLQGKEKILSLKENFVIPDEDTYVCADDDIAVVDLSFMEEEKYKNFPAFGKYDHDSSSLYTRGKNNSPRGYTLFESYSMTMKDEVRRMKNENFRPLFENSLTGERFNFIQMANMYDFSCNFFPSSPERYNGNAVFIPVSSHIKNIAENPSPFVQRVFNSVNDFKSHIARARFGSCRIEMNSELSDTLLHKKSYFSKNLLLPAGIVPGMSGAPLLINEDLNQSKYQIAGMVSAYDRRVQVSHFIGANSIKACLNKAINKDQEEGSVFKFDPVQNTLYRVDQDFVEIPFVAGSAGSYFAGNGAAGNGGNGAAGNGGNGAAGNGGNGAAGNGGNGAAGNGGNGAAGNGGNGAAGNGGDQDSVDQESPKAGLIYKGEHTLGFKCEVENSSFNIYANWEARYLVNDINSCDPITVGQANLAELIRMKFGTNPIGKSAKANNLHSLKLNVKVLDLDETHLKLQVKGSFYVKDLDKDIHFKDEIIWSLNPSEFNPFVSVKISTANITNWFNKYEGGEELLLDLRELFFINLERVYEDDLSVEEVLIKNNIPKLFGSLKSIGGVKGSVPLELQWD